MKRPIVLDTDFASDVDDALALALALASPELELVAVTTVGHESRLRARVAKKLLELAGRGEVPVYAGCRVPVLAGDGFNGFGHEGVGILEPGEEPPIESEHAVDALLRLFGARRELELVAIGPLTNLAVALMKDPDLAGRVRRLTVMGGHIRSVAYGGHEFAPGVDYNLCSDPHASLVALRAGMPVRLVTADVTLQTWLEAADVAALDARGTPFHRALARSIRIWTPVQNRIFGGAGCDMRADNAAFLHDPLALACAYDESHCRFEDLEIEPALENGVFRTLERPAPAKETLPMRCATAVDARRFRLHYVERVCSLKA
jgi:purine nucleosidase